MFKTFINAFKVKELRQKLLYTFFVLIVVRLGSLITVPGIRAAAIKEYLSNALGDSFNLFMFRQLPLLFTIDHYAC